MEELLNSGQGLLVIIMTLTGVGAGALVLLIELLPIRRGSVCPVSRSRIVRGARSRRTPYRSSESPNKGPVGLQADVETLTTAGREQGSRAMG